jgi:hypothetical protein
MEQRLDARNKCRDDCEQKAKDGCWTEKQLNKCKADCNKKFLPKNPKRDDKATPDDLTAKQQSIKEEYPGNPANRTRTNLKKSFDDYTQ